MEGLSNSIQINVIRLRYLYKVITKCRYFITLIMSHRRIIIPAIALTSLIILAGFLFLGSGNSNESPEPVTLKDIDSTAINISDKINNKTVFGIPVNHFHEVNGTIKRNQNLANILDKRGISPLTIHNLARESRKKFDVRHIRSGHNFHLYLSNDTAAAPRYFVYEIDPVNYVVFNIRKPELTYTGAKKVTNKTVQASGIINTSLYNTLASNDIAPVLTGKLAEIFAWEIDFYHIQKGDRFKVIYNKQMIDGTSIGIGSIKAAYFKHNGKDYYAFAYDQDGEKGYFDLNGQSLKKAFLKAPLKYNRISSRFSYHRYHPVLHRYLPHLGVDFAAPTGTPVHAVGDGVIEVASYNRGNGRYIKIRHNNIYETEYLHLSRFARGIHHGKTVKQGQLIGYVGSTGLATGPHLDYRIWKNGREVNPLKIDLPSSDPIEKKNMDSYNQHMALLLSGLNSITFHNDDRKHLASNVTPDTHQNRSLQDNSTL